MEIANFINEENSDLNKLTLPTLNRILDKYGKVHDSEFKISGMLAENILQILCNEMCLLNSTCKFHEDYITYPMIISELRHRCM